MGSTKRGFLYLGMLRRPGIISEVVDGTSYNRYALARSPLGEVSPAILATARLQAGLKGLSGVTVCIFIRGGIQRKADLNKI